MIGGQGSDEFYFSANESFKKNVDKVVDFESTEGDKVVLADDVFGGLIDSNS